MKRILAVAALSVALGAVAACGGESLEDITPAIGVDEVAVLDDHFEPRVIQVSAGTTVTWTWQGGSQHDVIGAGFRSPLQSEGTFSHTFEEPGWYPYLCRLHAGMTGAVTVTQ